MFWALSEDKSEIVEALPGTKGWCPMCGWPVVAKCGTITCWHFSHRATTDRLQRSDCDEWVEKEGPWHKEWKSRVPQHMREYVLERKYILDGKEESVTHRADILNSRGTVIELQHSPLSPHEIRNREKFYIDMIWVFDATEFHLSSPERLYEGFRYVWKWARKTIKSATKPVFFDVGSSKIFRVRSISNTVPCYVTGEFESKKDFLEIYFR